MSASSLEFPWRPAVFGAMSAWVSEPARVSPLDSGDGAEAASPETWETACIHETQRGRPEAFNPLVAHYAPRIRAYLYRMLRSHEEAEDLTQDTFLKAFQALARFDSRRPFKSWLYTIATNTGLNAIRARARRGMPVELDADLLHGERNNSGVPPQYQEATPGERLEAAMAGLSPRAAQLVTLHYHEGFSLHEAGEILGLSEGAAKVALCRARRQLRERLVKGKDHDV